MCVCGRHKSFLSLLVIVCIVGCSRKHSLEGFVVDYASGDPIAAVSISVIASGWDFSEGVWDRAYSFDTKSDNNGKFKVEYKPPVPPLFFDSSAVVLLRATHSDYLGFRVPLGKATSHVIKMKRRDPGYKRLPDGNMKVGLKSGIPYGWSFLRQEIAYKEEEADIFPFFRKGEIAKRFTLRTYNKGGISFVSAKEMGVKYDLLVYTDRAPIDGYISEVEIDLSQPGGVYFVRTRDGSNYAKFELHPPAGYMTEGSERGKQAGNWALSARYVYNPSGSSALPYESMIQFR